MTYRQGARGEGVKLIQRLLKETGLLLTVDGDFGPNTTEAVKAYQRAMGLTPVDGIVGSKTIAKLTGVSITPNYIYKHITAAKGRPVKYIAIHYTAGASSRAGRALSARNVFLSRSASADFVVDDATIVQVSPSIEIYYCWAVGDAKNRWTGGGQLNGIATNRNTVSIEICSSLRSDTTAAQPNHEGWSFTPAALEQARRLVRYLMLVYDIPRDRVVRHYDITGKLCPGVPGWNNGPLFSTDGKQTNRPNGSAEWTRFMDSI